MARRYVLYNVERAVGPKCPNEAEDVLLVRFLLRRFGQAPGSSEPGFAALPLISTYDEALGAAIRRFQERTRNAGRPITVDGVVSSADLDDGWYTIKYMNASYFVRYRQYNCDLRSDPECPSLLREKFKNVTFVG